MLRGLFAILAYSYIFKEDVMQAVSHALLVINTKAGKLTATRPTKDEIVRTKSVAKAIFVDAFSTTYTEYHAKSRTVLPIAEWLRLKEGLSLEQWLHNTFDGEYEEWENGEKEFIHLYNESQELVAWLSHSPLSKTGEVYLSQCSLEAKSRNKGVATTAFAEALKDGQLQAIFPGIKEIKLITRKINEYAMKLYTGAGFALDEKIDPSVYGESYDDRYVGYRLDLSTR